MNPYFVSAPGMRVNLAKAEVSNDFLYQAAARSSLGEQVGWGATFETLRHWALSPVQPPDDEFTPPLPDALGRAGLIAERLRELRWAVPSFTVPEGDGGLAFEWRVGSTTYSLCVEASGSVQLLGYVDGKLTEQRDLTWLAALPVPSMPGSQGFLTSHYVRVAR